MSRVQRGTVRSPDHIRCTRCGVWYHPRLNVGELDCRVHPLAADEHGRYRCCGVMSMALIGGWLPAGAPPWPLQPDDLAGCCRIDHSVAADVALQQQGVILQWPRVYYGGAEWLGAPAGVIAPPVDPDDAAVVAQIAAVRTRDSIDPDGTDHTAYEHYLRAQVGLVPVPAPMPLPYHVVRRANGVPDPSAVAHALAFHQRYTAAANLPPPPSVTRF